MDNQTNENELKKYTILCVDDEESILSSLNRLLRKEGYKILTASSAKEGLKLLEENKVNLVITDQRMPEMDGAHFLAKVRESYPTVIRIMLTGYTDVDAIADSINKGHIYKMFFKPWNNENLKLEIKQVLQYYDLVETNKNLNDKVMEQNRELNEINNNLEALVEERTKNLEIHNQALQVSHAILDELPVPIIGVGTDGMIIITNRAGESLFEDGRPLIIGSSIYKYFPEKMKEDIESALSANERREISGCPVCSEKYTITIIPLTSKSLGKGGIMTFIPRN